jgi:hypothetical protein
LAEATGLGRADNEALAKVIQERDLITRRENRTEEICMQYATSLKVIRCSGPYYIDFTGFRIRMVTEIRKDNK